MSPTSMTCKQKKRVKNVRNKYLKPGALAQLCYNRITTRSCTDISKKRVLVVDDEKEKLDLFHKVDFVVHSGKHAPSPRTMDFHSEGGLGDGTYQQIVIPATPKTPDVVGSGSRLESLPIDILVQILCHLHHDQLRPVFHVSQRIRKAVLQARNLYFNYTTPDRSRLEMLRTMTPLPTEHWPFVSKGDGDSIWLPSPQTPKAPKHGPRPPYLYSEDISDVAAVLFRESTRPSKCIVPHRVLFCEDELCQAVVCKNVENHPSGTDLLDRIFAGVSVYNNYTGNVGCFDLADDPHGMSGWDWQV